MHITLCVSVSVLGLLVLTYTFFLKQQKKDEFVPNVFLKNVLVGQTRQTRCYFLL